LCENEKIGKFEKIKKTTLDRPSIFDRVKQPTNKFNWIMSLLSTKNGFRGEYLARYIVSRFAFISESSVGEDFGIDFYCGLNKEDKLIKEDGREYDIVKYDKPFVLQIKSKTVEDDKSGNKFITLDTKEKIKTLHNLEIPYFLGYLDMKTQTLHIYSTSSMWFGNMLIGYENIDILKFKITPNIKSSYKTSLSKPTIKNGLKTIIVDLGKPIISLKLYNVENDKIDFNIIRKILSDCIDIEFENILSKRLGLSYFRWVCDYDTNKSDLFKFGYKFVNSGDDSSFNKTTKQMINNMHPYLVALAVSAKNEYDDTIYKKIIELTQLVDNNLQYKDIIDDFGEVYDKNIVIGTLDNYTAIPTSGQTYSIETKIV